MLHLFQKLRIFKLVKITPKHHQNPETANRLKLNKNININNKKHLYYIYENKQNFASKETFFVFSSFFVQ